MSKGIPALLLLALGPALLFAQSITDEELLGIIERKIGYTKIFSAKLKFEVHAPNKKISVSTFTMYENDGESIVRFETPARDKGKMILQIGNKYWIYFPKTKRSSVLSPLTTLVGNASNGDVMRPAETTLYNYRIANNIEPRGDRVIIFEAKSRKSPYGKVISHYQGDKLIYSAIYSRSNILLKSVEYRDHILNNNNKDGAYLALYAKIVDGINPEKYTIMTFSNVVELNSINQNWFNPRNLGKVR